jgi:16S rRNA (cytosine1402-N4)-methyltransferase
VSRAWVLDERIPPRVTRSPLAGAPDGSTLSAFFSNHPRSEAHIVGPEAARGLRVTRDYEDGAAALIARGGSLEFSHSPVMLREVVELLSTTPSGVLVDATVGGGGHAAGLLSSTAAHRLIGIDRDGEAVAAARAKLAAFGARAVVVHARFDRLADVLAELAPAQPVSGVLFDLGVSSRQFDEAARGFSYRFDAPLDMRMDPTTGPTAADIVNSWTANELAALFKDNGENRFAARISQALVASRPVRTTGQLVDVVRASLPAAARHGGGHPAKRVFQALRIAVNEELDLLGPAVDSAMELLVPDGRCVVLSYHSGEDRIVKDRFAKAAAGWCTCPPEIGCVCGAVPAVRVLTRGARLASAEEIARNPRASSARLRAAERLDAPFTRAPGRDAGDLNAKES